MQKYDFLGEKIKNDLNQKNMIFLFIFK